MKKLLLLLSLLLATNAWGEISGLSCESTYFNYPIIEGAEKDILDLKKHGLNYQQSFLIDNKKKEITFENTYSGKRRTTVLKYDEEGTSIKFRENSFFC